MDIAINNGLIVDPGQRINSVLHLGIDHGRIVALSATPLKGDICLDATGSVVAPAFIDIHLHEAQPAPQGTGWASPIFEWALRMGVGTCLGGNCGEGPGAIVDYLEQLQARDLPINVGMLIPHGELRLLAGQEDKYKPLTDQQLLYLEALCEEGFDAGCQGISLGIRYVPGIDARELRMLGRLLSRRGGLLAVHLRDDAAGIFAAAEEMLQLAADHHLRLQLSHIGSMAGFGQMERFLAQVDWWASRGVDVWMDCYPYTAFSTGIGETTFDPGFLERYQIDYSAIEVAEGEWAGQRLDEEKFRHLRGNAPGTIVIAHVMQEEEVAMALTHPRVMVASDGFLHGQQGHPRAAGTFARFLGRYVREEKLVSLYQAIEKVTTLPARQLRLGDRGGLAWGQNADITIFDPQKITDCADFSINSAPPEGVNWVIIKGKICLERGVVTETAQGEVLR